MLRLKGKLIGEKKEVYQKKDGDLVEYEVFKILGGADEMSMFSVKMPAEKKITEKIMESLNQTIDLPIYVKMFKGSYGNPGFNFGLSKSIYCAEVGIEMENKYPF